MKNRASLIRRRRVAANSTFEDSVLIKSAIIASSKAMRSSVALGLTIKIIKDNKIMEIKPGKSTRVIRTIDKTEMDTSAVKKGMVFVRK